VNNEDDRSASEEPAELHVSQSASSRPADDLLSETPTGQTQTEQSTDIEAAFESTQIEAGLRITDLARSDGGRHIGKYQVIEKLSEGGQAEVFRVVHPTLRKELALKLCKTPVPISNQDRHEVVAEGRLLAELDHPGLSRIYDVDFDENRPYLVMEYIRGRNLREIMRNQEFTPDAAVNLVIQVARSVDVAHQAGITHRDLKPENIVIDDSGKPRVIDFGLAILRHGWAGECIVDSTLSGTVRYMAPEQARCEVSQITARSDVFALGAILFELLTLQPLNSGDGVNGMLRLAREGTFDPSALDRAKISSELRSVCEQATAATASRRHADAGQLADALTKVTSPKKLPPRLMTASGLVVIAGLLAGFLLNHRDRPSIKEPAPLQELVQLRAPEVQPLSSCLPAQSGDEIRIQCDIPSGLQPLAIWFDTEAALTTIPMIVEKSDPSTSTALTARTSNMQIVGPGGTELIIVLGNKSGPNQSNNIREFLEDAPWPELPDNVMVIMSPDRVEVRTREQTSIPRGAIASEPDRTDEIVRRLEILRQQLANLELPYFSAVAFPHVDGIHVPYYRP
tara:strand:+ start:6997 stop:8703 length:1707 start_codon:yes stop_codon:yes gene_type:complete